MKISHQEAIILLVKWYNEKQIIAAVMGMDKSIAVSQLICRIDGVADEMVRLRGLPHAPADGLDLSKLDDMAADSFMKFPLIDAEFEYEEPPRSDDSRNVIEAKLVVRSRNGLLFGMSVLHPTSEIFERLDPSS